MRSARQVFAGRVDRSRRLVLPAALLSVGLASAAEAENFKIRQSLSTQSTVTVTSKEASAPLRVGAGRLTSMGVAQFAAGNRPQEVATVALEGGYEGGLDNLKGLYSQVLSFADGSTIKLYLQSTGKGTKFEGTIVGSDGAGRFKGIRARGSVTGTVYDPGLNYMELQGDYDLVP